MSEPRRDGPVDLEADSATVEAARSLGYNADLQPVVLNTRGNLVAVGRRARVVPPALRRALAVRDPEFAHPGCQVPPAGEMPTTSVTGPTAQTPCWRSRHRIGR